MTDRLADLRTLLTRPVPVEQALEPYLGVSAYEADKDADSIETSAGLIRERLHALVMILALRNAPPGLATLATALLWRSAPVARNAAEIIEAIHRICDWRMAMSQSDVGRIVLAHQMYTQRFEEIISRTGDPEDPEIRKIVSRLDRESRGGHVVAELGDDLLIVEMTDSHFFVGLQDDGGTTIIIDMVPHVRGGGWERDNPEPEGPRPLILQDA